MISTGTLLDLTAMLAPAASAAIGFVLVVLAAIFLAAIRRQDVGSPPPAASAAKASDERFRPAA